MGGMWFNANELPATVSETVGYKSGLALTFEEIEEHLNDADDLLAAWEHSDCQLTRIRTEEYEYLVQHVLERVGYVKEPILPAIPASLILFKRYRGTKREPVVHQVNELWLDFLKGALKKLHRNKPLDASPFLLAVAKKLGVGGYKIAVELLGLEVQKQMSDPWSRFRRVEWSDTVALRELFESERLETLYGNFLDQRFVDYLGANQPKLDSINWRKFEGLVGEFFARCGYSIELGPGRNDDGVDIRVWPATRAEKGPPLLLVQCKREKRKISKVVVKALWADVIHEGAAAGLVVTTTALSPGARKVAVARGYNLLEADHESLQKWLAAMRTPGSGIFLGT
jgi:restriction system protein